MVFGSYISQAHSSVTNTSKADLLRFDFFFLVNTIGRLYGSTRNRVR